MTELRIRSILVTTDLQAASDDVLRGAAEIALRAGAELHLLHALDLPRSGYGTALHLRQRIPAARNALREQIARALPPGVQAASEQVWVEAPPAAINLRAEEVGADLIVLGPHQPRMFRGPILGTTADRVLRSARVPVLILGQPVRLPLRRVVIPIDLSDPASGALDQGLLWARTFGEQEPQQSGATEATVLHVVPRVYEMYDFPFDRTVLAPELNREIVEAVERIGGTGALTVRDDVVWGNSPGETIIHDVEDGRADLLVMGTHGYGALGRALVGSITSAVARATPCPMLLVPAPMWAVEPVQQDVPIEVELAEPPLEGR
jgi:universal stress protein E